MNLGEELICLPIEIRKIIFSFFYQKFQGQIVKELVHDQSKIHCIVLMKPTKNESIFEFISQNNSIGTIDIDSGSLETRILDPTECYSMYWNCYHSQKDNMWKADQSRVILNSRRSGEILIEDSGKSKKFQHNLFRKFAIWDAQVIQNGGLIVSLGNGSILIMK
jgi:hypothetical protein